MEASSSHRGGGRGPWSHARGRSYSKETQEMLRLMMQECKLSTPQRKRITDSLRNGTALPLPFDPTPQPPPQPKSSKPVKRWSMGRPQRRCAEDCRSGDNYCRDMFRPGPRRDLDKEKRKLQNIMATGEEEDPPVPPPRCLPPGPMERIDPFQEVVNEIEERRQFLADMAALGQEQKYINIINTEIALKIKELELLDQSCVKIKEGRRDARKGVDS